MHSGGVQARIDGKLISLAPSVSARKYSSRRAVIYLSSQSLKSLIPNMAGNKDRVYWNDSKTTVRKKLGLEDNEDFSKFEVGLLITLSSYTEMD